MKRTLIVIVLLLCVFVSACGKEKNTSSERIENREVVILSKEEIKQTLGIISDLSDEYRNGTIEEREEYIKNILEQWQTEGNIAGNISQDGTVIWFEYNDGEKQGLDISKDRLWEGDVYDLPAPFGSSDSDK